MTHCPHCQSALPEEGVVECPVCQAELLPLQRCPRCQAEHREPESCPFCGERREAAACATHPERETGRECVICGRPLCAECLVRESGHAALCARHENVTLMEGWAEVYTARDEFEAQLLRESLEAQGMDARVYSQQDHAIPVHLGELSILRLLVPAWHFEAARTHVEDFLLGRHELLPAESEEGAPSPPPPASF